MELRPYYFARELIKKGHKVTIVASSYSHYRAKQPKVDKKLEKEIIESILYYWIKTPQYKRNNAKRILNIFIFLFKLYLNKKKISLDNSFDIVIASSTYPLDIYPSEWFAKKFKAKLIYEVHDLWPLSPMVLGNYSKRNPFIKLLQIAENYAYDKCDYVISLLNNAKDHMVEHGLKPEKFHYIPNGIDKNEWENYPKIKERKHLQQIKEFQHKYDILIGYTGTLGPANAMDTYIEAANLLRDESFGFIIAGSGQEEERLKKKAELHSLENICFLDPVDKKFLPDLISQFDIMYIGYRDNPLYKYGICPNKLFDYMMAGKPVILALGYPNEIIEKSGCGIQTDPEKPEQIVKACRKLFSLGIETREYLGKKGKEYTLKHHSFDILVDKLLKIIHNHDYN